MDGARVSSRKSKGQHPSKEAAHREREAAMLLARPRQTTAGKSRSSSPYSASSRSSSPSFATGILGPGHKIARGRGRKKQLDMMTDEQKTAEREMRMEKMRLAARECRARKKLSVIGLEQKLAEFHEQDEKNRSQIAGLQDQVRRLQQQLRVAQQLHHNQRKFGLKAEPSVAHGAAVGAGRGEFHFQVAPRWDSQAPCEDNGRTVPQQAPQQVPQQQTSSTNSYGQSVPLEFPFSFGEMDCLG